MKIGPLNESALSAAGAARAERSPATGGGSAPAGESAGVPVSVSSAARTLEVPSAGSGIDEAKVAAIRAAIANGTFTVDAGAVADKLLANAQEVLGRIRS